MAFKRCVVTGAVLLGFVSMAAAEDAPKPAVGEWTRKTKLMLGLTQSAFTQNWSGDEVGTVSWLGAADFLAESQATPRLNLNNTLVLNFGQTHQQDAQRDNWLAPRKSADKIEYRGVARATLGKWVDPFFALSLDGQFFQKVGDQSEALNPLTVGETAGLARAFYDTKTRSLVSRVGFGFRQRNDRFAVAPAKKTTNDGGFEWRTTGRFASPEDKTVFKSELTLFQAVFFSGKDQERATFGTERWKTLDARWQNQLSNKLNKWMSLDVYFEYLFDKQLSKAGQFKQTLGVGVTAQL